MSRDAGGTYTLPSGNPVVSGNTISSTWANTTLDDIKTEITDSLSRSGEGSMLVILTLTKGLTSTQSTTDTAALTGTGNGTGAGVVGTGGATGNGGTFAGTSTGHGAQGTAGAGASAVGLKGIAGAGVSSSGVLGIASNANNTAGVYAQSNHADANGVKGQTNSGTAADVAAVYADSNSSGGYAFIAFGDTTSPVRSAMRVVPQDAQPTTGQVGDMYVTTAGVLKICTVAGSPGTWVSVGAQ